MKLQRKKNQKASQFNVPLSSFNRFLSSLCYKITDRSSHMNKCNVASSTLGFEYIKNLYYLSKSQEIYWIKSSNTCKLEGPISTNRIVYNSHSNHFKDWKNMEDKSYLVHDFIITAPILGYFKCLTSFYVLDQYIFQLLIKKKNEIYLWTYRNKKLIQKWSNIWHLDEWTEIQKGPIFTKLSLPKYAFFLDFNRK